MMGPFWRIVVTFPRGGGMRRRLDAGFAAAVVYLTSAYEVADYAIAFLRANEVAVSFALVQSPFAGARRSNAHHDPHRRDQRVDAPPGTVWVQASPQIRVLPGGAPAISLCPISRTDGVALDQMPRSLQNFWLETRLTGCLECE
jgi:hypothetical protein